MGLQDIHVYVDDLLISTTTFSEHLAQLRVILQKVLNSGMTLKFQVCEFLRQRIKFLGHVITPSGISMDASKLNAVRDFPMPRNRKDVQ